MRKREELRQHLITKYPVMPDPELAASEFEVSDKYIAANKEADELVEAFKEVNDASVEQLKSAVAVTKPVTTKEPKPFYSTKKKAGQ